MTGKLFLEYDMLKKMFLICITETSILYYLLDESGTNEVKQVDKRRKIIPAARRMRMIGISHRFCQKKFFTLANISDFNTSIADPYTPNNSLSFKLQL